MKSSLLQFSEHFNFHHEKVESLTEGIPGATKGIQEEALYSKDTDLLSIFRHRLVTGTFCDLGCGTGRAALLYGTLFPDRKAIGIEFQNARLEVGKSYQRNHPLPQVTLLDGDLSRIEIPHADTYFLYFPTGPVLDRVLSYLYERKSRFTLVAIESHGDLLPRLSLENWLEVVDEVDLESQRHYPKARIYRRTMTIRDRALASFDLSFQECFLLVSQKDEDWLGETLNMEWTQADQFELHIPPRTIFWKDVKKVLLWDDLGETYRLAIQLRRNGELTIKTATKCVQGVIRKIIVNPTFRLEISTGETVEWSEIMTITQGPKVCYESLPSS